MHLDTDVALHHVNIRSTLVNLGPRVNLGQRPSWVFMASSWAIKKVVVLVKVNLMATKTSFGRHMILIIEWWATKNF